MSRQRLGWGQVNTGHWSRGTGGIMGGGTSDNNHSYRRGNWGLLMSSVPENPMISSGKQISIPNLWPRLFTVTPGPSALQCPDLSWPSLPPLTRGDPRSLENSWHSERGKTCEDIQTLFALPRHESCLKYLMKVGLFWDHQPGLSQLAGWWETLGELGQTQDAGYGIMGSNRVSLDPGRSEWLLQRCLTKSQTQLGGEMAKSRRFTHDLEASLTDIGLSSQGVI